MLEIVLTKDSVLETIDCYVCGDDLIAPYGHDGEVRPICSTCDGEQWYERRLARLAEAHKRPRVITDSDPCPHCSEPAACIGTCWREFLLVEPVRKAKPKKEPPKQLRLF